MRIPAATLIVFFWIVSEGAAILAGESPVPDGITVVHNLRYREGPSQAWLLDLAMPKDRGSKPRPAIVVIHGGGWLEGDRSSFASREFGVPGNIVDLAMQGFVAVTINYRLSGEAPFPAALEDCQCAVRWLRAHASTYHVDPEHIGAFGNSAGGQLALLLGMADRDADVEKDAPYRNQSSRVQAVVSDSGPIDLVTQYEHDQLRRVVSQFLGGPPVGRRAEVYRRASPRYRITASAAPMLLIYGAADEQVPVSTADEFVVALGRAGLKDVNYCRLAYVGHCPYSLVRIASLQGVVNDFFRRTLMNPDTAKQIRQPVR